ncbi:HAMP domain-containing sensor histidine kinase [Actinomadura sp. WMMA1423]|uniref:sensor histidine kinase n=1 Tax=Actinomadura sp. WMMA1423 TaxID=2591108 RepID=UPI0011464930|nr:ATP-binding protein [Actinomadura sp. WMMA1423]
MGTGDPARANRVRGRRRWTIRLRLTLLYGALFLGTGVLLLAVTYVLTAHSLPFNPVRPSPPPRPAGPVDGPPVPGVSVPSLDLDDRLGRQRAEDLRRLLVASGLALVMMTFVSVWLGWLTAGRALRPLRAMTATAREISARNLHQRLDVRGPDDEIKNLADTFDGLLGRLEAAFEAQRAFVANASHELRTPLTFERSLLEVALADPDASAADLRAACRQVLAGNRHQERLIEALLTLARSQRGLDRAQDTDLAVIAAGVVESAHAAAAACGIRIEPDLDRAVAPGDPHLVERLLTNLVDNAVRHNVPGGRVSVWTGAHAGRPALRVANTGPAVPPGQVDEILQPFRRLDGTRTGDGEGLGLGLSIVAAIATAHGADLGVRPRPEGGLDIRVVFRPDALTGEESGDPLQPR